MASIEEYVELLLPMQQETIAIAALRGVTWERTIVKDSVWVPGQFGGKGTYEKRERTRYVASVPAADGQRLWIGTFDDVYECAVVGLSILAREDAPPTPTEAPSGPDAPFALAPGNEQPTPERKSFRWPRKLP